MGGGSRSRAVGEPYGLVWVRIWVSAGKILNSLEYVGHLPPLYKPLDFRGRRWDVKLKELHQGLAACLIPPTAIRRLVTGASCACAHGGSVQMGSGIKPDSGSGLLIAAGHAEFGSLVRRPGASAPKGASVLVVWWFDEAIAPAFGGLVRATAFLDRAVRQSNE